MSEHEQPVLPGCEDVRHSTGRCTNEKCGWVASWPDLDRPCPHCGYPIRIDKPGEK